MARTRLELLARHAAVLFVNRGLILHVFTQLPRSRDDLAGSFDALGRWLCGLSSFFLRALFQRCFARKFYAAFVIDADALDPNDVAHFGNVFGPFHAKIRELGNMHQPISTRENFDKRAKFLR